MHGDGFGRTLIPILSLARLNGQSFDCSHAMNGFNQHGLSLAFCVVQGTQAPLVGRQHGHNDGGNHGREHQHNQCKLYRVEEQDRHEDKQGNGIQARNENSAC